MEQASPSRKVCIKTFGCQMNAYDSDKMLGLLEADGYASTDDWRAAQLVIVNTCSVREKPEHKLRSLLGSMIPAKRRSGALLAISGCMAQHDGAGLFRRYPDVDLVFGPDALPRIRELVRTARQRRVLDNRFLEAADYPFVQELSPVQGRAVTALVTIQKGCDNHCTYCIVPHTRGREVSRPSQQVLAEVRALAARDTRDFTLIGQNVNAYGLKRDDEIDFAELLQRVHQVPEVLRLRFTTSHPRDFTSAVTGCWERLPRLASHLHLPVQSGSDLVLRRMGRGYDREQYLDLVSDLRAARPDISLTTDFITGFPGETRADFAQTLSLLETVGFDASFSFQYSVRPHTAALRLHDRDAVDPVAARARLQELQALQARISAERAQAMTGRVVEVLVEGPSRNDPQVLRGRTSCFRMVNLPGSPDLVGQLIQVRLTRAMAHSFQGEALT